jgi:hypothetical protein
LMIQGSYEVRSNCIDVLVNMWDADRTILTSDSQTFQLFGSFLSGDYNELFVKCAVSLVETAPDVQLLIDTDLLKSLLPMGNRSDVLRLFIETLSNSIVNQETVFLQYLVDIGVLSSVVNILHQRMWYHHLGEKIKTVVGAVMKADERYEDMVFDMEISEDLKSELRRGFPTKRK